MILAIDVGGTKIKYAYITSVENFERHEIDTNISSPADFIEIIHQLCINRDVARVSISMPGFLDKNNVLIRAGALKSLDGFNIKKVLERELNKPVYIENDAKCAAIAEKEFGNGKDINSFVMLTLGTGIGGAIIFENKILRGVNNRAGEIGMLLSNNGGQLKTMHEIASTSALIYSYNFKLNKKETDARKILDEYTKNDKVRKIVDEWAFEVAVFVFNVSSMLNPEKILIGGGISENPILIELIRKSLNSIPLWSDFSCEVEVCKHRNNAGIIGAYFNALNLGL